MDREIHEALSRMKFYKRPPSFCLQHIYIDNIIGYYNPSVRIIDLVSNTTFYI